MWPISLTVASKLTAENNVFTMGCVNSSWLTVTYTLLSMVLQSLHKQTIRTSLFACLG